MSDNEIRKILIERKRKETLMQRREAARELIGDALCWICWAALGYIMFAGAFIIGG